MPTSPFQYPTVVTRAERLAGRPPGARGAAPPRAGTPLSAAQGASERAARRNAVP
jgi:hypothetical protein